MLLSRLIDKEFERIILWIPVFIGIGIGIYFNLPYEPHILVGFNIWLLGLAGWIYFRKKIIHLLFAGVFFIGLGFWAGQIRIMVIDAPKLDKPIDFAEVIGTVEKIERMPEKSRLILTDLEIYTKSTLPLKERKKEESAQKENTLLSPPPLGGRVRVGVNTPKKIQITVWKEPPPISSRIKINAKLFPISKPNTVEGFNYSRYMFFKQIGAVGYGVSQPEILSFASVSIIEMLREKVRGRIFSVMSEPHSSLATALITGQKHSIDKKLLEKIRMAGIAHVLAISGMHIGLVCGIIFFTVRFVLSLIQPVAVRYNIKKIGGICALLGGYFYLSIAGFPISAQRAFLMASLVITAILLDRKTTPMRFVCTAATIILLLTPEALLSVSFQLSFAATIALIAAFETLNNIREKKYKSAKWGENHIKSKVFMHPVKYKIYSFFRYFIMTIFVSFIAITATTPFTSFYFNQVSSYGMISNMIVLPILSFWIMPLAFISLIFMTVGAEALPLKLMEYGLSLVVKTIEKISAMPEATQFIPSMEVWGLTAIAVGGLWLFLWQSRIRLLGIIGICIGLSSFYFKNPPDIMISKSFIGINGQDKLLFLKKPRSKYIIDDMLKITGHTEHKIFEEDELVINGIKVSFSSAKCDGYDLVIAKEKCILPSSNQIRNIYSPQSIYINDEIRVEKLGNRLWN